MPFNHFIITRFSYRGRDAFKDIEGPTFHRRHDPLDPERLELRFRIFEITCLPSVLGQIDQTFAWILLVDSQLPPTYYQRLQSLVERKKETFLHFFDPKRSLATLDWLGPQVTARAGYVMTTNLDDDDCVPTRFVAALHHRVEDCDKRSALAPIGIVGATSTLEWDFLTSANAPLGWRASWHRGRRVSSVGLSLYCKVPEFNLCVLGIRHAAADTYLDFSRAPVHANAQWFQRSVARAAKENNLDLRAWRREDLFHDISQEVGAVLMGNHPGNDQATRLFEPKADRVAVSVCDFPNFSIDWEKARTYARFFGQPTDDPVQR